MVQEHIFKLHRHKNILYSLVVILVIINLVSFISLSSQVSKVNSSLEKSQAENEEQIKALEESYTELLDDYNSLNQEKFNEITKTLLSQKSSFEQELQQLKSSNGDFSSVIEEAVKGVVSIGTDKSGGSGFIVSEEGYIATNYHVVENANRIAALTYDGNVRNAELIGYDKTRDIALLKVSGNNYPYLDFGDSNSLQVGRKVIAIGNPLGLSFTVTEGIISALDREGPNGLREYIQTDVSLNPGNSGGPLINTEGKVIGVNNFKVGNAESLGFALESNVAKNVINELANQTLIE